MAKCPKCGETRFELEETRVGSVSGTTQRHLIAWTLFKCANPLCGVVISAAEGTMIAIAERQGFKR